MTCMTTSQSNSWEFVVDTTISEVVKKYQRSAIQLEVDVVQNWTEISLAELNEECKELRIDLSRNSNRSNTLA